MNPGGFLEARFLSLFFHRFGESAAGWLYSLPDLLGFIRGKEIFEVYLGFADQKGLPGSWRRVLERAEEELSDVDVLDALGAAG